jgi:signal transduction histidine kinase
LKLILDISRLEAGSFQPNYQRLDVKLLLTSVANQYMDAAEQKGIKLKLQSFEEKLFLEADENFLQDTLDHLIDNAIKYTEEGSVTINTHQERLDDIAYIVIDIVDTGIGISEENQSKIFEEFRQESEGYGRTYEGTGLGLSLAKKYVELMGGFIRLKSKVGLGSTFSVYIPESPEEFKPKP